MPNKKEPPQFGGSYTYRKDDFMGKNGLIQRQRATNMAFLMPD